MRLILCFCQSKKGNTYGKTWLTQERASSERVMSPRKYFQSQLIKVSEYSFKQNKNMLKNMTVLLYKNFYNISLNVLRSTFFNIYNLPFLRSANIGKIRVKVRQQTELQFSINFFHWYVANQETNKTVPAIFFFPNIFLIIYFQLFSCKIRFQSSSSYCNEIWISNYSEKRGHDFV